ncbi:hypothetical protein EUGRSUZ_K00875 [Eucalyptus grandis]|uniref:Uncharacterized protein n=2 Tax=Eucalyptus grandis TaxID=71139 RepID=A0ACC3IRM7_EUCGR|nr:hypothetical protein EUGRSUZ_K00875 [Eucalyptus grandis]
MCAFEVLGISRLQRRYSVFLSFRSGMVRAKSSCKKQSGVTIRSSPRQLKSTRTNAKGGYQCQGMSCSLVPHI